MHLAICLWGLLRALPYTYESIHQFILQPLQRYNYTYDVLMHTYELHSQYKSSRNKESGVFINTSHYHLLQPQYIHIEDQDEFDQKINFWLFQKQGDPWKNDFMSFKNHLRALNSLHHVAAVVDSLVSRKQIHYDGILFIRPDVRFIHPLPIELLPINDRRFSDAISNLKVSPSSLYSRKQLQPLRDVLFLPDFHRSCKGLEYNDRMALGTVQSALTYGKKFLSAYNYSLKAKLHAEKFTFSFLRSSEEVGGVIEIPFRFQRIRSTGELHIRDYEAVTPVEQARLIGKGELFVGKGRRTPLPLRVCYTLVEYLTLGQRYIWNHDDHGNIFCHPQPFIHYDEFLRFQKAFQATYTQYQHHLTARKVEADLASRGNDSTTALLASRPHPHPHVHLHAHRSRQFRCGYRRVEQTADSRDHRRRPDYFLPPNRTAATQEKEKKAERSHRPLTFSFLQPVDCVVEYKHSHSPGDSHRPANQQGRRQATTQSDPTAPLNPQNKYSLRHSTLPLAEGG
jgi:hypothetical protein